MLVIGSRQRQGPGIADQAHIGQSLLDDDAPPRPLDDEDEIEIAVADFLYAPLGEGAAQLFTHLRHRRQNLRQAAVTQCTIGLRHGSSMRDGARDAQALGIDIDDQGGEQDQAVDQDLQEAVDIDVIEAIVEDTKHEQTNDRVADAATAAEQAGAADYDGSNGIEQIGAELILLSAAEIGDAEHARQP